MFVSSICFIGSGSKKRQQEQNIDFDPKLRFSLLSGLHLDPPPTDISTGYEFLDSIMRCGLYLGAFFQIICLAAVVMAPDRAGDPSVQGKEIEGSDDEISDHSTPQATPRRPAHTHHRQRRQEKKKRR